ncbi:BgTH12-01731 [Blumeria graminis f. sp. triticale]|uniref:BgTH12-01731 n=1 Tax=Blumeria graminis f. sp. triticale TaxID=1689686 RepID=A0A9W4DGS2_BLUGR|nr:BgTH12-01731 [Blumeria graminis f. sp. triticale]
MTTVDEHDCPKPIFKAVSGSTRQLFQLLKCIRFATKVHIQISSEGLRFAVEESRVMQGIVFLDRALFTSYSYLHPECESNSEVPEETSELPNFQISLPALLETLQMFGVADQFSSRFSKSDNEYKSNIRPGRPNAFSIQSLGMPAICRLSYEKHGSPLNIVIEESNIVTTCHLNTYQPEFSDEIPFQRDAILIKIIMQARWLFDAISEISSTSPTQLEIKASPASPYLSFSATGDIGSASVEFSNGRDLLETYVVSDYWSQSYNFEMIKSATEAMKLASKVSIRGDEQGVLSLQFMVEVEGSGISYIDFRFIPLISGEDLDGETN